MWLDNWDKGEAYRAFRQLCAEYKLTLYFKTLH